MINELPKMNDDCKESLNNTYAFKEVPDLFFINKEINEIFYCMDAIESTYVSLNDNGKWQLTISTRLFSNNISQLWKNCKQAFDIYSRNIKRKREDGKDYDFCLKLSPAHIIAMTFFSNACDDNGPSNFSITFLGETLEFIDSKSCPKVDINSEGEKVVNFPAT